MNERTVHYIDVSKMTEQELCQTLNIKYKTSNIKYKISNIKHQYQTLNIKH